MAETGGTKGGKVDWGAWGRVLMGDHFHLLRETPEANLSRAMHRLNVSYPMHIEGPLRQGVVERPWDRLVGGLVLGNAAFANRLLHGVAVQRSEQTQLRRLRHRASWAEIVPAVERFRGEGWGEFRDRHGDCGRDAALWLGRRTGRLSLAQLGQLAGGMACPAVVQALTRFGQRMECTPTLRKNLMETEKQM